LNAFLVAVAVDMVVKGLLGLHCMEVLVEAQEDIAELQSTHPNLLKQVILSLLESEAMEGMELL
jgi:hypothetical protein